MRRKSIVALAGAAVLAVMPATVLAQGKHHASHPAKRHHVRTHIRHFRAANSGSTGTTGTTGTTTTPGTPGSDSAGKVTSFDGTTLVITPTVGPPVSGVVTNNTQLSCESSQPTTVQSDMSSDGGGSQGGSGDQGGSQGGSGDQGDSQGGSGDQSGSQADQGDTGDQGGQTSCTTANLTQGTTVHEADLSVSSAGSVWDKVALITG
jgi:hypothetical protein